MTHTIYLDILFCVNFVIDYMILLTVRSFLCIPARRRRLLAGAVVGGISSFVILLPPLPSALSLLFSIAFAMIIVGAAFAPLPGRLYFKTAAAFFLMSFFYCGAMIAVWLLFSPENVLIRNSSVYISMSPVVLIVSVLFCYVIICVIMRITGRGRSKQQCCGLEVVVGEKTIICQALIDTGSTLREPFSGDPVITVAESLFEGTEIMGLNVSDEDMISAGLRLVPYNSINGEGMLKAFRADKVFYVMGDKRIPVSAYIALCPDERLSSEYKAIIPSELTD